MRDVKLQVLLRQDQVKDRRKAAIQTVNEIDYTVALIQKQMNNWDKRTFIKKTFGEISIQAEAIL